MDKNHYIRPLTPVVTLTLKQCALNYLSEVHLLQMTFKKCEILSIGLDKQNIFECQIVNIF